MLTKYIKIKTILIAFLAILTTSCGGGGSNSPSYEISTDVTGVNFNFYAGDTGTKSKTVVVTYKGDGVIVGYGPDDYEPYWLDVDTVSSNNTTATFRLTVQYDDIFSESGEQSVNLRFVTGKVDGSAVVYKQIPVTFNVIEEPSPVLFSVNTSSADLVKSVSLSDYILDDGIFNWELISSSASWLSLETSTGTTGAGRTVNISINKDSLLIYNVGEIYSEELTIAISNESTSQQEITVPVNTFIQVQPTDVTDSTANEFDFTVDEAAISTSVQKLYLADKSDNRVYIVDINSGETVGYYDFAKTPQSISVSPNGQYLYVALKNNEASYDENYQGAIAVVNTNTGYMINKFFIEISPSDIEGNDNGEVFVTSANIYTLNSYNALNGELELNSDSAYRNTQLSLSAEQDSVFAIDMGLSPQNLYHYTPSDEGLTEQESPFHGDYHIGFSLWANISDDLILTSSGNLFDKNTLDYIDTISTVLNYGVIGVTIDSSNNKLLVLEGFASIHGASVEVEGMLISSFDLPVPAFNNYQVVTESMVNPQFIFSFNGQTLVVEKHDTHYQLKKL